MADDQTKDAPGLPDKVEGAAESARDERDATIERLESAIAEERQHSATLRKTAEELRFKAEILETSYAKQLEDARLRSETAERDLADQQAQIAALETAHEDAMQSLAQARRELDRAPANAGKLRRALASTDGTGTDSIAQDDTESQVQEGSLTINTLMKDSSWAGELEPIGHEEENSEEQERADEESTSEELIAPDLVFTVKRNDNS